MTRNACNALAILALTVFGVPAGCAGDGATTTTEPPAIARQLVITTAPAGAVSGSALATQPTVELRDASGSRTTTAAMVTASVSSGGGTLIGSATTIAVAGVATFNDLRIDLAGDHTLTFSTSSPALSVTSSVFTVAPGAANALAVSTDATGARRGTPFSVQPLLALVDAAGNRVRVTSVAVTMGISASGSVIGTSTVTTVDGLAQFVDAGISGDPGEYTLTFSALQLAPATQKLVLFDRNPTFGSSATHGCGVSDAGNSYCWGGNYQGAIGDSTWANRESPTRVITGASFASIYPGFAFTCALTDGGDAYCWGRDWTAAPQKVVGNVKFVTLSTGMAYTCGLTNDGTAYCWGGLGVPAAVSGGHRFSRLQLGRNHRCGITLTRSTYCWGENESGQLGDGTTIGRGTPVAVGGGQTFVDISIRDSATCGLTGTGDAYCWGRNWRGYLFVGNDTDQWSPALVEGGIKFTRVFAGTHHNCGFTASGVTYCWGMDCGGQLGDGASECQGSYAELQVKTPTVIAGGISFVDLGLGSQSSCGLSSAGIGYCWGSSLDGGLGLGLPMNQTVSVPTQVAGGLTFKVP